MTTNMLVEEVDVDIDEIKEEESAINKFLGSSFHLERAGVIRPGIMVPKKECPENLRAVYKRMAAEERPWTEIATAMGTDPKGKSWLTMSNVDYFTLRPFDCANPDHCEFFRKKHCADKQIKRFPIVFPFDEIDRLISTNFSYWSGGGLIAQGTYHGDNLICRYQDQQQGNKQNKFQKREYLQKPCDPENCNLYKSGKCKFRGEFVFRIPGMPGLGVWTIYTSSWYSMRSVRNALVNIKKEIVNGWGSLSHLPADIFHVKKLRKRVGRDQKEQWLFTVDTDYAADEIVAMLKKDHDQRTRIHVGAAAAKMLNGTMGATVKGGNGETIDTSTGEVLPDAPKSQATAPQGGRTTEQQPKQPERPATPGASAGEKKNGTQQSSASQGNGNGSKTGPAPAAQGNGNGSKTSQPATPQGGNGNGSKTKQPAVSPFVRIVQPYLKDEMRKVKVFDGVTDAELWIGVVNLSKMLFDGKDPKGVTESEAKQLVDAIKKDIQENNLASYGVKSAPAAPAPSAEGSFMDGGEFPDDIPGAGVFAGGSAPVNTSVLAPKEAVVSQGAVTSESDYAPALVTFIRSMSTHPLFKTISKTDILRGVENISQELFKKPAKQVADADINKLISAISGRVNKKDMSVFVQQSVLEERPTLPANVNIAYPESSGTPFMDGGEFPAEIPNKSASAASTSAPKEASVSQCAVTMEALPKPFANFVLAIMKNPGLAKAPEASVLTGMETLCQRSLKKSLLQMDDKDATALRTIIQGAIKANNLVQVLMFGK